MTPSPSESPPSDFAAGLLVYAATGVVFYPLTRFLFENTLAQEQLLHAFAVLAMAGVLLIYERQVSLRPVWVLGPWCRRLLAAAGVAILLVFLTGWTILMIPAFSFTIASAVIWVFGERVKRIVGALVGAFALFQLMVLVLPLADWPLRGAAGRFSAAALDLIGREAHLGMVARDQEPVLLLATGGMPFEVAAECNGFGVIVSSFLLALLLVVYRRIPVWRKVLSFLAAGVIGLIFNVVRIVIIVLLAPVVGLDNYHLMHEVVGTIAYYAALVVIWFMILGPKSLRSKPAPAAPVATPG